MDHCNQKQVDEKAYVLLLVYFILEFVILTCQVLQPWKNDQHGEHQRPVDDSVPKFLPVILNVSIFFFVKAEWINKVNQEDNYKTQIECSLKLSFPPLKGILISFLYRLSSSLMIVQVRYFSNSLVHLSLNDDDHGKPLLNLYACYNDRH